MKASPPTSDPQSAGEPSAPSVQLITIEPLQAGQRIDNFLMSRLKGVPKSRIYRLIRKGEVRVNRKRVKAEYRLQGHDVLRIPPVRVAGQDGQAAPSPGLTRLLQEALLYSDQDVMVLNKPAGLAVHGGTGVELGLIEALRQIHADPHLELAHRLDKGTSGCLLIARHPESLRYLGDAFRERRVSKVYHAIVSGSWPDHLDEVNLPLERQPERNGERMVMVSDSGRTALTRFRTLEHFPGYSLVEARPETGRTHQIRVHAARSGHPICGDSKYQAPGQLARDREKGIRRLCLHAAALTLTLPNGETQSFSADPDTAWYGILGRHRQPASAD